MIQQLVEDTLKKEGKWSRTSLTMFTSYIFSLTIAALDYIQRGFNFEVFLTLIGLSAGVKFSAALEKRLTNKTKGNE
jgi:hypothetical protein